MCLVSLILIGGYRNAAAAFRLNPSIGGLMLAYIIAAAVYSITEAGFRMLRSDVDFSVTSCGQCEGRCRRSFRTATRAKLFVSHGGTASRTPAANELIPERETVHAARYDLT